MDFIKKAVGGDSNSQEGQHNQGSSSGGYNNNNNNQQSSSSSGEKKEGGFLSGIGDKLNGAAGGGRESEKNEDYLDKGLSSLLFSLYTVYSSPPSHVQEPKTRSHNLNKANKHPPKQE